jgi:hypothetical protein
MRGLAALATVIAFLVVPGGASAQHRERVDLYDTKGRREGYAIVDRDTGRVDVYDRHSRRTGHGNIQPDGRLELFDSSAVRRGVVPPSRDTDRGRR